MSSGSTAPLVITTRFKVGLVNNVKSCETVRARLEITIAIGFDVKKLWISLASLYLLPIYSNILVPLWFRNVITERGLSSHSASSSLLSRDSLNGVRPSHSSEFQHQVQNLSSLAGIRIKVFMVCEVMIPFIHQNIPYDITRHTRTGNA